ncbi:putative phosphoglycerate mutase [Desulfurella amilsii]|uniref:Putative phosphoglycerate mutase n=1 Tax=Desulfurella amilsii TaxID=1562698 RepID=A0A1X4XZX1_9BACT|nr:ribonuclease HI family protein [Desulfurella amilsii]OSS43085.1 putative phosphoglycerate mutase [Desulfurella amilsii]
MKLDLLKKFCEFKSVEKTADYFGISIDDFFGKISQICGDLEIDKPLAKKNHLIEPDKPLSAYIDGASSNNPGHAGIGIVFIQDEQIIDTVSEYIGEKTNNEAEYTALIEALKNGLNFGVKSIKVFSDSELVVKQIKGVYAVKQEHLKKLNKEARLLIEKFEHFEINHIVRSFNAKADKLAKSAIEHNGKLAHR